MPDLASTAQNVPSRAIQVIGLIGWLVLCFGAAASAALGSPDDWYARLQKPSWNPPGWVFGPAWSTLYTLMAIAAWLVWRRGGWRAQAVPLGWFLGQWLLNALWTPLFFGLHRPDLALIEILVLAGAITMTLVQFGRVSRPAAWLLVPYLAWVCFASALNATLWWMNRS